MIIFVPLLLDFDAANITLAKIPNAIPMVAIQMAHDLTTWQ